LPEGFISVVLLVYFATLIAGFHSVIHAPNGAPPTATISAPAPPPIADDILLPTSGS